MSNFTYEDAKYIRRYPIELKRKKNRTIVEEKFLEMDNALSRISIILVEESKLHLSAEESIKKIRQILSEEITI